MKKIARGNTLIVRQKHRYQNSVAPYPTENRSIKKMNDENDYTGVSVLSNIR